MDEGHLHQDRVGTGPLLRRPGALYVKLGATGGQGLQLVLLHPANIGITQIGTLIDITNIGTLIECFTISTIRMPSRGGNL